MSSRVLSGRRGRHGDPEVHKDQHKLMETSYAVWGPDTSAKDRTMDAQLVKSIYQTLHQSKDVHRLINVLEASQYLEQYLWMHLNSQSDRTYIMSIVLMINEKFKEHIPPWSLFQYDPEKFSVFFERVLEICIEPVQMSSRSNINERAVLLIFLIHCFNSLEVDLVRNEVQKLTSLGIWINLQPTRLEKELKDFPKLKKYWTSLKKKDNKLPEASLQKSNKQRTFLFNLIKMFFTVIDNLSMEDLASIEYCEKFIEFMTDLICQPLTRRFFIVLLEDCHFVIRCLQSDLAKNESEGHLFSQLLERLKFYCGFEVDNHTGEPLTEHDMTTTHYNRITSLQLAAFKLFPGLKDFSLSTVAGVDRRDSLHKHFSALSNDVLHKIAAHLCLIPPLQEGQRGYDSSFLLEVLIALHERRPSQLESLNNSPLYPTETILWDESLVPNEHYVGEGCFALPKLNLQFLTLHDYLLRNFVLFQLESTYEIKEDIEDVVSRMKPWINPEGETNFAGWARMGQPINKFSIVEVGKPKVGENRPSRVKADVEFAITKDRIGSEWESLRKHDVCFLVTIRAQMTLQDTFNAKRNFAKQIGVDYVRGCEIEGMLDSEGKVIEEGPEMKPALKGTTRTYRIWLDTNQYQQDMERVVNKGEEDVYETFNIFVRRKPKENNFKAVLESIRDLMNTDCIVPDWFHDILLGYGDPSLACYTKMSDTVNTLNFNDTFLTLSHLIDSFPQYKVNCSLDDPSLQVPPFKITFPDKLISINDVVDECKPVVMVEPFTIQNRGPYLYNQPKKNSVPFTPMQIEAIHSGMQPGLTLVVGPPGTGKTDVAVQIISNLYHNYPNQRTLLVTHSNQALNQLFEKIMELDIEERHLLRLGHGEEELQTEKDFSRYGRVNFILALRLELLQEVERLQKSLNVTGDVSYTCETASHFYLYQVLNRWEKYCNKIKSMANNKEDGLPLISKLFPFTSYFSNAPQPIFKGQTFDEDWEIAQGCFRHIDKIFKQLEEFRAFELLRSSRDRVNYLLMKEAKIIALTCTHAALKRQDLVQLSFKYDNVLMEESAQILEVETFIPLMLQTAENKVNRLKRIIMIGDHHQLPPVIKNQAFQKFSNMEQSMFTRLVRLGVPLIQLDAQGRARPSLCALYSWRYRSLGNLPHVLNTREYHLANPGFQFDYQFLNVDDFNGIGETTPTPFFYQNLGEAEYAVAIFMYMRLQGYPPDKIAILTTYNGQKHLIRDVLQRRCAHNPVFGLPEKVTTVDRYQGQQNDYIIISLVRTRHVGHLRDVRRLVVAMSRARLGLYILGRVSLFKHCQELQSAFNLLLQRPVNLHLIPNEFYPADRLVSQPPSAPVLVISDMSMLADFVYKEYHTRVEALQKLAPPPANEPPGDGDDDGDGDNDGDSDGGNGDNDGDGDGDNDGGSGDDSHHQHEEDMEQ